MIRIVEKILAGESWSYDQLEQLDKGISKTNRVEFLTKPEDFKNYENEALYNIEKKFLEWFNMKLQDKAWMSNRYAKRYTMSMLVYELYGREYDLKIDNKYKNMYSKIFRHYSGQVLKSFYDPRTGKAKNKTTFVISPKRKNIRAYSLRLRAEQIEAEGKVPTVDNMKRRSKLIKPGQARDPYRQSVMDKRAERGRKYYERYSKKTTE